MHAVLRLIHPAPQRIELLVAVVGRGVERVDTGRGFPDRERAFSVDTVGGYVESHKTSPKTVAKRLLRPDNRNQLFKLGKPLVIAFGFFNGQFL